MIGRIADWFDHMSKRWIQLVIGLLVVCPFVVAWIRIYSWDSGSPMGDWAALDLDVRSGFATLGSYSQYGFRHPGPLFIWWMKAARLVGDGSSTYILGMTALSAAFVGCGVWIAWRSWGRRAGVAVATGFLLLTALTGWNHVTSPWNPMVGILGVPLLIVVAAAAWDGDPLSSAVAVAVGSFLVQAHVGNAGVCIAVLAALAVGQAIRVDSRRALLHAWGAAAGTAVVLWAVPGVQQLVSGRDGNFWKILQFSRGSSIPKTGMGDAVQAGVRAFRPLPAWLGVANVAEGVADHGRPLWLLAPLGVAVVLLLGGVVGKRSRKIDGRSAADEVEPNGERVARLMLGIASVGWVAAVTMLGVGRGPVRIYYTVHIESLAAVICASSVSYLALRGRRLWQARSGSSAHGSGSWGVGKVVPVAALAGAAVFAVITTSSLEPQAEGSDYFTAPVEAVKHAVESSAATDGPVVVSQSSPDGVSNEEFSHAIGFLAALKRSGLDVSVGLDIDPKTDSDNVPGLQLAVPTALWVETPRQGDFSVVLFSGDEREVPDSWQVITRLPNGTLVTLRPE